MRRRAVTLPRPVKRRRAGLVPPESRRLRDCVRSGVRVLFVGINPGMRSAATGHHFAGPSNRFWRLLYESGVVPTPITHEGDRRLPEWGLGVTNLVPRATPGIDTLQPDEYRAGLEVLRRKIRRWRPKLVVLVGLSLYRSIFGVRGAIVPGLQTETLEGVPVFVLPNPSGRNAHFSYAAMLDAFRKLAQTAGLSVTAAAAPRAASHLVDSTIDRVPDRGPDPVQVQSANRVRAGRQQR